MATLRRVSIVLLACAMFAFVAAKKEMKAGASEVDVADDGEMTFKHKKGNASDNAHPLKIRLDELSQMDINGKELADCNESDNSTQPGMGWMKHGGTKKAQMKGMMKKFRKFQNQKFSFEAMKKNHQMRHGSMKGQMLKFKTALSEGIGKVTLELVAPDAAGDITLGEEKQKLKKGDMKFNMELSEWNWCENAAFLDVYMKVVGKQKPKKRTDRNKVRPSTYYVGDNVTVSFSGKVRTTFIEQRRHGTYYVRCYVR